jgi:SAM-dependent methyltransferase
MLHNEARLYVSSLYQNLLQRDPGASEFEHWVNFMLDGNPAEDAYYAFVNSQEYKQKKELLHSCSIGDNVTPNNDVLRLFSSFDLDVAELDYLNGQSARIGYLRDLVQSFCSKLDGIADILDVGPHFLTRFLAETASPRPRISTLGYAYPKILPAEFVHGHANIDLNECGSMPLPFASESFDVILICEVIEHLFIPPSIVLSFLRDLLKRPGGVIIAGTPNAVSISKRLRMMMGENPYQELSPQYRSGKVHIREYTMHELHKYGTQAGLKVVFEEYCNYWDQYLFPGARDISALERDVETYRGGLTIVYQV